MDEKAEINGSSIEVVVEDDDGSTKNAADAELER
jgi:ABC-type branched-subunit amino acid transport system substrate-binding protein